MKPAVCGVCGKSASEEPPGNKGEWLKFADYSEPEAGTLVHPNGMEYLCRKHVTIAKTLTNMPLQHALEILRLRFGSPNSGPSDQPEPNPGSQSDC